MRTVLTRQGKRESGFWKGTDRRASFRYEVGIPLRYRRAGRGPDFAWKLGRSLDMSARGIRIDIPETMPTGSRLELSMDWPGLYHGTDMVRLSLVGCVTRVDGQGVALRILRHRFLVPAAVRLRHAEEKRAVA
jgi:hypothetical protein